MALRYTLSGCMFAWPSTHISISSPCQVSCAVLNESIEYQITNDTSKTSPELGFCNVGAFDSTDINRCAFCYSFVPQQLYLANCRAGTPLPPQPPSHPPLVSPTGKKDIKTDPTTKIVLQALHIACVQPPLAGKAFFPDAAAIFNETLIAGPAPSSNSGGSGGGLHGWKLALAVALPIVGGILLIGGTCWCCFAFTRKRRQRMAQTGRMSRVHDANADHMYSPMSAKAMDAWSQGQPPTEMHAISPTLLHAKHPSPGMAQGRWSHHQAQGEESDHGTPLRTSFQQPEVIGPGNGQLQDPRLHEQYFGSTDEQDAEGHFDNLPGPSGGQQQQEYYHPEAIGVAYGQPHDVPMQDYERGHFI